MQSTCVALTGHYFGGRPIRRTEVEVRVGKLKKGKVSCKDEVVGEMRKGRGNRMVDWMWRLCNMAFGSGVVPGDWRSTVLEWKECSNYRGISLLSVVEKIYAGILVNKVHKATEGLINNQQGDFRVRKGCVDQISALKQIGEEAPENECRVYVYVLWIWRRHMLGSIGRHYSKY